ncbi:PREDICTED: uncharacterized protein LOC106805128 [Priapulus caudatus]|uniref:Uncharacterized protein LOC106805128 n=1 Tax=Priapulus caudatus TaxID=37621 RepID=A0ABM1DQ75_PRICU|nr:PREDICTED: uncharacterized protein LOC106805128 [Priapulus caudatus]
MKLRPAQTLGKHIKVKVSLLKANEEVVFVDFNGVGSNKVNWFSQDRILRSSFSDLPYSASMNYASIAGSGAKGQRRFFLQKNYGGCDVDAGWVVIADRLKPGGSDPCWWEQVKHVERPAFLYCPKESNCKNKEYVAADTFLILVQRA